MARTGKENKFFKTLCLNFSNSYLPFHSVVSCCQTTRCQLGAMVLVILFICVLSLNFLQKSYVLLPSKSRSMNLQSYASSIDDRATGLLQTSRQALQVSDSSNNNPGLSSEQLEDIKDLEKMIDTLEITLDNYKNAKIPDLTIVWRIPCDCGGLQLEALNLVYPLYRKGLNITIDRLEPNCFCSNAPHIADMIKEMAEDQRLNERIADVVIGHQGDSSPFWYQKYPATAYAISRVMWESDGLPADALEGWGNPLIKEIWVPSKFNVESFARSGINRNKLYALPESIDTNLFSPTYAKKLFSWHNPIWKDNPKKAAWTLNIKLAKYNFFSVFKHEQRKNWKMLLRAFVEEFQGNNEVALFIKTSKSGDAPDPANLTATYINDTFPYITSKPRVVVLDGHLHTTDFPLYYYLMDCFILASHGEGWGLPVMEAMSMELPVIVTAWGGSTEFAAPLITYSNVTQKNSIRLQASSSSTDIEGAFFGGWGIKVARLEPAYYDPLSNSKDNTFDKGNWAIPDIAHLKKIMRYSYEHQREGKVKGRAGRRHIVEKFSHEAVAVIYLEHFRRIEKLIKGPKTK